MKIALSDLCLPNAGQVKLEPDTLVDYFDISSVDNISKTVTDYETYPFAEAPSRARKAVRKNSILVSTVRPNLNAVALFQTETDNIPVVSTGFCVLDCKESVNPRFVFNFCRSKAFIEDMVSQATGASYPAVSDKIVRAAKIPQYSLEQQNEITQTLDSVSSIIEARKQQLQKLDELVKARFVEMFGDPLTENGRYSKVPLGSLAEVGSSKRIFEKEYVSEGIPFYRTKEIVELSKGNGITTELFITKERYDEICSEYGAPQKGDLLISAVGTIGVIWIVDGKNDFYFKDGNLLRVSVTEKFVPEYLKHLLEALISAYKLEMSSGTAYAALTISALKKMIVYDVPHAEQEQFAAFVEQTDKSKVAIQKALVEAQLLFDSLMQKYFG